GRARALTLAAIVHLLLLGFLWIGVRWQNEVPVTVEAEIWSPQARDAAPRAPDTEPEPPAPRAVPAPRTQPKPVDEVAPTEPPDIALERIQRRKAQQDKAQAEQARKQEERDQIEQKRLEKKKEKELEAQKQRDFDRLAEQDRAEQKKADAARKRKADEADSKQLARIREEEMRRITSGVSGTGGSGDAPKSQGARADQGYVQKVGAKIKSNTVFNVPESLDGNPNVEYEVQLLPDGSLRGKPRKLKSSGVPGFDEAVLYAIEKSAPFPADKSGTAPAGFTVSHKPKD
ncbi:MAG: TonB C-terminal domain-containing protein, partial [Pseudomonadota bacterium]|nr:TonB C-terminal domain-containing protein [Pseudomonadota bacterium]